MDAPPRTRKERASTMMHAHPSLTLLPSAPTTVWDWRCRFCFKTSFIPLMYNGYQSYREVLDCPRISKASVGVP